MNSLFWIFIAFLGVQRISELILAQKNEKILKGIGAKEYDKNGYLIIVLMHIAFFVSLIIEKLQFARQPNSLSLVFLTVFILTQFLRYWAISSLGKFWNTKILVLPKAKLLRKGPYKYIKHPNYLAVIIEIALIPLIFSCYITAAIFSILNFVILLRRIKIEENVLGIAK